jgi:hypothetical protein
VEQKDAKELLNTDRRCPCPSLTLTGDVPMTKVKIGANQEYQYITNFKVLQKAFKDHGIDKVGCLLCSSPSLNIC